jgi:hypothetical protein
VSNAQFRAGSSIRGSGGTVHPAAQIITHPRFDYYDLDFDVAVAKVSDNVFSNLNFLEHQFKIRSNTLNETVNLVYNLKSLQLTAALTLRNTTNRNYYIFRRNFRIQN